MDTYNPSSTPNNPSFFGSEIITQHKFGPSITVEFRAQLLTPVNGLVGGLFLYEFFPTNLHSEIDFELLSNFHNQVQTNIYDDEPLGSGKPELHVLSTDITQFNIYRIEWSSTKVNWFVNNELVREYTTNVPQENLSLHLNFYVPACDWAIACDPNLQPALSAQDNKVYFFNIDWVRVCTGIQSETVSVLQKASVLQILNNLTNE